MLDTDTSEAGCDPVRLLVVIVLYNMRPAASSTYKTVMASKSVFPSDRGDIRILIFDNSENAQTVGFVPSGVRYEAPGRNMGLAAAYNRALAMAESEKCDWLLTLDQDTTLPSDFLSRMSQLAHELESDDRVAAIVPHLCDMGRALSPVLVTRFGERYLPRGFTGIPDRETRALNSGSLFRVSALRQIGGYDPRFWLDFVDTSIFRRLALDRKRVYVAGSIQVEHELSLLRRSDLKPDRFRNILLAESAFSDLYDGYAGGMVLTGRLLGRIWKQWKRKDDVVIRRLTWEMFKTRILCPKEARLHQWKSEMQDRKICSSHGPEPVGNTESHPIVSVCMATYNGERFIHEQLASVLCQLGDNDEIVIVDDASTDNTIAIIQSFGDRRIRILKQTHNSGVLQTFGRALKEARGEIIFLADQDDVWRGDKISKFKDAFAASSDLSLVLSDCSIIDADGIITAERFQSGKFHASALYNIVRNRYLGCSMAFRRSVLNYCLPFPPDVPMHDMWIGIVNQLTGKTGFLDEPLMCYRRHDGNASPRQHAPVMQMIRWRWALAKNVAFFYMRRVLLKKE
jgi:glycosyltransferase involved in cell wall biosynthesis